MKRSIDISDMSKMISFDKSRLKRFIKLLDEKLPKKFRAPKGDISLAIFDDKSLAKIHSDFLGDPTKTDVITFDGDESFAGEICVSAERAKKCARKYSNTASRELCLYIAHGYLHLANVNDISESDAAIMRQAENLALNILDKNFRKPIFTYDD